MGKQTEQTEKRTDPKATEAKTTESEPTTHQNEAPATPEPAPGAPQSLSPGVTAQAPQAEAKANKSGDSCVVTYRGQNGLTVEARISLGELRKVPFNSSAMRNEISQAGDHIVRAITDLVAPKPVELPRGEGGAVQREGRSLQG